jgi:Mrp family chromosome partitioning ATPase
VIVSKRLEPLVLVPIKDIEGRRGVITVTTIQAKEQEVLREMLKYLGTRMLGIISKYVGR